MLSVACVSECEKERQRHNERAPRHLENSPMKMQLDGQKSLQLSLSLTLFLSLSPSLLSFSDCLEFPYFLSLRHLSWPPGYTHACPPVGTYERERQKERMGALGRDIISVTYPPTPTPPRPLSVPRFRFFNLHPQRTST